VVVVVVVIVVVVVVESIVTRMFGTEYCSVACSLLSVEGLMEIDVVVVVAVVVVVQMVFKMVRGVVLLEC
jgi:hypothetical protein